MGSRSDKSSSVSVSAGDLIEIRAGKKNPAYIARLNGDRPVGNLYVPTSIVGVWLGWEPIDLGVDVVQCETFLYEGARHVLLNGTWKKLE